MVPEHLRFGGGVSQSVLNPLVLLVVLIAGVLMYVWPRKKVLGVFLVVGILVPMDQVLLIGGMHFPMLRLLALFGIARLIKEKLAKRQIFSGGMNKIDWAVILLAVFIGVDAVLLFRESGAVIFQLGNIYTVFGVYFLFRFLIADEANVLEAIRMLGYVAAFVAVIMAYEQVTGHNPYALLGGANASSYATAMARDDRFRAMACFAHPLLAGTFGATLFPLFVLLWQKDNKNRKLALVGLVSSTVITVASNSSTPILAYGGGVLALCMWPIRDWMRVVRWSIVIALVSLHMVMKAPVWHLISRIDLSGGSSSYHRFMLVDQCIRHFGDWWLIGVKSTADWGWDMWDTSNQFAGTADNSGLLPLILFIAIFVYGFKYLGRARKVTRNRKKRFFLWALGAALFAHMVSYWGVSYFDQIIVPWYCLLAAISTAAFVRPKKVSDGALCFSPAIDESMAENEEQPVHRVGEALACALQHQSTYRHVTL